MAITCHAGIAEVRLSTPVEVGSATGHHWFPSLHRVGELLVCAVAQTADVAQGEWPGALYVSSDDGTTWQLERDIGSYGHASARQDERSALVMPYETWPTARGDRRNAHAAGTLLTAGDGGLRVESREVRFLGFPDDLASHHEDELMLHHNGLIRAVTPGVLLTSLYGKLEGKERYRNFAVVSEDGGYTWHYQGTIAVEEAIPGAPAGPSESDIEVLESGELLCICRIGTSWDYGKSYSQDGGRTWSAALRMDGVRSVQPRLCRLANGTLLLCGGKPGLFVWVCTDGHGDEWQPVNLGKHHNQLVEEEERRYTSGFLAAETEEWPRISTTYPGVTSVRDDSVLIACDRLSNDWNGAPGSHGSLDCVFAVTLRVSV